MNKVFFFEHFLLLIILPRWKRYVWFFLDHFIRVDRQEQKFVTKVVKAVLKMSGIPEKKKSDDDEDDDGCHFGNLGRLN